VNEFVIPDTPKIRDVIVFGLGQIASLTWFVLTHDSPYRVVAFTVDAEYLCEKTLHDLPVVPFEELANTYPPESHAIHLPIGWKEMNGLRTRKLAEAKDKGYRSISYVSSRSVLWPDLRPVSHGQIHNSVNIGPFVELGENCLIYQQAVISHHTKLGDNCYLGPNAMILAGATVGDNCVLGAASRILSGVTIAPRCFIGAGAIVTKDTEYEGLYVGLPARRRSISPQ
jgi:sugar O-acyltransferase (sialic acid O-acetyltransferase NeuD family)